MGVGSSGVIDFPGVVDYLSVSAIPAGFVGTARVGTDLYSGNGVVLNKINTKTFPNTVNPLEIANLTYWMDAQGVILNGAGARCENGDTVTTISDTLGTAVPYAFSTIAPKYATNAINGYPALDFSGSSYINLTSFFTAAYANAVTVFIVAKRKTSTGVRVLWGGGFGYFASNVPTTPLGITTYFPGISLGGGPNVLTDEGIYGFSLGASTLQTETDKLFNGTGAGVYVADRPITGSLSPTGDFIIGNNVTSLSGNTWIGYIGEVLIYNKKLTQSEFSSVYDYLSQKWGYSQKTLVTCIGDSLTAGSNSTGGQNQLLGSNGNNYPNQLRNLLGTTNYDLRTDSYGGRTLDQIKTETPFYSNYFITKSTNNNHICVLWETYNTLYVYSPEYALNLTSQICRDKRAAGYEVIVCTGIATVNTAISLKTSAFNEQLRGCYQNFADGLCDLASDGRLSNASNTTYYAVDGIHLIDAGYGVVASLVYNSIKALGL